MKTSLLNIIIVLSFCELGLIGGYIATKTDSKIATTNKTQRPAPFFKNPIQVNNLEKGASFHNTNMNAAIALNARTNNSTAGHPPTGSESSKVPGANKENATQGTPQPNQAEQNTSGSEPSKVSKANERNITQVKSPSNQAGAIPTFTNIKDCLEKCKSFEKIKSKSCALLSLKENAEVQKKRENQIKILNELISYLSSQYQYKNGYKECGYKEWKADYNASSNHQEIQTICQTLMEAECLWLALQSSILTAEEFQKNLEINNRFENLCQTEWPEGLPTTGRPTEGKSYVYKPIYLIWWYLKNVDSGKFLSTSSEQSSKLYERALSERKKERDTQTRNIQ